MHLLSKAGLIVMVLASSSWGWQAASPDANHQAAELRKYGIEPDRPGVEEFLRGILVTPERTARIRKLVDELGSERFQAREKAMAELLKMPPAPLLLKKESEDKDLETKARVKQILANPRYAGNDAKVAAVLQFIKGKEIKGLASLLLELMPQWPDLYLSRSATTAIMASAEMADAAGFRRVLAESQLNEARIASIRALAIVLGPDGDNELAPLLKNADPRLQLAAAIALLNHDNRQPLPILVELLDAQQQEIRQQAVTILVNVSDKKIDYAAYDPPEQRAGAVAGWRDWAAHEGLRGRLHLPVRETPIFQGRILIGIYAEKTLREVEAGTGKTLFESGGFNYLWGCHATPEGHRLAVDYADHYVVEYDSQGKECWRKSLPGRATSVERLANGRTLIALPNDEMIIELDKEGAVVWKQTVNGLPTMAQRLPSGNTLVSLQNAQKVVEIDQAGKVVWELGGLKRVHTAQKLENGNVLVCDMELQLVTEYDRSGKAVWSKGELSNPAQAQRLPSGNTLISDNSGVREFDNQGNVVRHIQVSRAKFFAY